MNEDGYIIERDGELLVFTKEFYSELNYLTLEERNSMKPFKYI